MALIEVGWTKSKPISIRDCANTCGFNLMTIDLLRLPSDQRRWIEQNIVNGILADLDKQWEEDGWDTALCDVTKGIYTITLAGGLCVDYEKGQSQVVYIGKGHIRKRIRNHLTNWVTHFSESLHDIKFRFWMTEIKVLGSANAFKEVEADLIDKFWEKYGAYPISNSKSGDDHNKDHYYNREWTAPLQNEPFVKSGWSIKPMPDNEWFAGIDG